MSGEKKPVYLRLLDLVEVAGNRLPHPFWLFCGLIVLVVIGSAGLSAMGVSAETPASQILKYEGKPGRPLNVTADFPGVTIELPNASRSSRLDNVYVELHRGGAIAFEKKIDRTQLARLIIEPEEYPPLKTPGQVELRIVNRSKVVKPKSLLSANGLVWFVLNMVANFSHFEPLGLVLVMLMGVAIAEGSGLITAVMRAFALSVPRSLITPVLFALAACGNIGSDAGIVVIPPLAAAIYRQMGKNPIVGLLVGYVGATAGFTANVLPAGTDVLAMSLTNAATGNDPEINVLANWYFMLASVPFLAILGTLVTQRLVEPRLGEAASTGPGEIEALTATEKKGLVYAGIALLIAFGIWLATVLPENGLLRHPDPSPDLFWRSPFFKGLIPILFSLFTVGGVVYGKVTGSILKADDVLGFMADAMKRMGPYIVLVLAISQFTEMFQFANLDKLIALEGAAGLRALGFENFPIPFFVAFVLVIAVANIFMGSASAKWAIFAPIFVPMFMALGFHPRLHPAPLPPRRLHHELRQPPLPLLPPPARLDRRGRQRESQSRHRPLLPGPLRRRPPRRLDDHDDALVPPRHPGGPGQPRLSRTLTSAFP